MKSKALLSLIVVFCFFEAKAQQTLIDFGTSNNLFECNPVVFTTSGQSQCVDSISVYCQNCKALLYYNTDAGSFGQDCRNWFKLINPGFTSIGNFSELQLRGAGGGNTLQTPARFVVRDFSSTDLFAIQFDVLMAGYGGEFLFRCGTGDNYKDTVVMPDRDSFSFMVLKFDDGNPSISQPHLRYSQAYGNSSWPVASPYFWASSDSLFQRYKKHTIAIYVNNTNSSVLYTYTSAKILNSRSYDVYVDSIIDISNMLDTFFSIQKKINSFMFSRNNAFCGNSGLYRGDTLVLDNIIWTSNFLNNPLLPIELSEFSCLIQEGRPKLVWKTVSELNNKKFEVERSTDGSVFTKVGEVPGAGTTTQIHEYHWVDSSRVFGTLYFRLKQIDFDSSYTYSNICEVSLPLYKNVSIFPNPFDEEIKFSEPTSGVLYNIFGQKILEVFEVTKVNTIHIAHGSYYFVSEKKDPVHLVK